MVCCAGYPTSVDTGARRSCLDKDGRKRCAALTTVGPTTCKGSLIRAPHMEQQAGFALDACTLPPIAIETWLGFVFVSLVSSPKPLAPELEPLRQKLRNYHLESMQTFYSVEWVWQTNWKSLMENFMEGYHLSPLHHNTLHPVNPTRLCKHYPPGEQYFGYEVGFAERVSGTHRGHPDLTDEERNTCINGRYTARFRHRGRQ